MAELEQGVHTEFVFNNFNHTFLSKEFEEILWSVCWSMHWGKVNQGIACNWLVENGSGPWAKSGKREVGLWVG